MYIDPKSQIAGIPIIQVRDLMRWLAYGTCVGHRGIALRLKLADHQVAELVSELLRLGYIEPTDVFNGKQYYGKTLAGSTFSLASAARPLTRKTAQRKLAEFLDRVQAVNANSDLAYRVPKVLVFGSYLTERDRISDVDVAVKVVARKDDPDEYKAMQQARVRAAYQAGRQFSSYLAELFWPYCEVLLLLKARSRAISLHSIDDNILLQTESRIVFQEE